MTILETLSMLDLLPERITDKEMEALVYALDPELQEITAAIEEVIIMPRIDQMPEDIVDLLAWQLHVDFYEPLGLSLDKKRALVKNSLDWHRRKGTKSVVEEIMRLLFFPEFHIEEWFEYGGRPNFFKAIAGSEPLTREDLGEAMKAIDVTKNERSWLDYIVFDYEQGVSDFAATMPNMLIQEYIVCPEVLIPVDVSIFDAATLADMKKEYIIVEHEDIADTIKQNVGTAPSIAIREHIAEQFAMPSRITDIEAVAATISTKEFVAESFAIPKNPQSINATAKTIISKEYIPEKGDRPQAAPDVAAAGLFLLEKKEIREEENKE